MLINPKTAIQQGWIKGIKNEAIQVQPNAIDFTADRIFDIQTGLFIIQTDPQNPLKEKKVMRGTHELLPGHNPGSTVGMFDLSRGSYDILSDVYVDLPAGVAALTIIRSSLCRNGLFLTSGLYDSGFQGHVGCVLHNQVGQSLIEQGTRIGQIMFVEASSAGLYAGSWNHSQDTVAPHQ